MDSTLICESCSQPFAPKNKANPNRFCSRKCRDDFGRLFVPAELREGTRYCPRCRQSLHFENWNASEWLDTRSKSAYCRTCESAMRKSLYAKNKERYHRRHIRKTYGLSADRYEALLAEQDYCCAICGCAEVMAVVNGGNGRFSVDHDHDTGEVRGLLCSDCNHGLGEFHDDPVRLGRAIAYLSRLRQNPPPVLEDGRASCQLQLFSSTA